MFRLSNFFSIKIDQDIHKAFLKKIYKSKRCYWHSSHHKFYRSRKCCWNVWRLNWVFREATCRSAWFPVPAPAPTYSLPFTCNLSLCPFPFFRTRISGSEWCNFLGGFRNMHAILSSFYCFICYLHLVYSTLFFSFPKLIFHLIFSL